MIFEFFRKVQQFEMGVMSTHLLIKAKAPLTLLKEAAAIAVDIEAKLSAYKDSSELSLVNKNAGIKAVECSSAMMEVLNISLEIAINSGGKFDPTIGVLTQQGYGFGTQHERLLTHSEKKRLSALVDYRKIEMTQNSVYLTEKGMFLDLGGVAKGYAVDRIINFLKEKKVSAALVSIGGEIHAYGGEWNIGIQHPRENRLLAHVTTTKQDTLVTTSGDYERFIKDPSHHHILQPEDAHSANTFSSLSLVSNSLDAGRMDALNTALFQMNAQQREEVLKHYDMDVLMVDKALGIEQSSKLSQRVKSIRLL